MLVKEGNLVFVMFFFKEGVEVGCIIYKSYSFF